MSNQNPHTVCIIGGGMSGLFTGALLAKNGYKVTVLEKNHIIGGGLQSFRRGDAVFNTGMQAFAGYGGKFAFGYFWEYLGIDISTLNFYPYNPGAQEIVICIQKTAESTCKVLCADSTNEQQLIISFNAQFATL